MGLLPVILIVGAVVLLVILMCKICKSFTQMDQIIKQITEESRHLLDSARYQPKLTSSSTALGRIENRQVEVPLVCHNDQMSQVKTLPQRQPHTQLIIEGVRQLNSTISGQSVVNKSSTSKRPLLHEDAIMKHINPSCNTDKEAIHFSTERNKKFKTKVNHVFKIDPFHFKEARENGVEVYKSTFPCAYWKCKKTQSGKFKVTEVGVMDAVFRKFDCHLLIEICRKTARIRIPVYPHQ